VIILFRRIAVLLLLATGTLAAAQSVANLPDAAIERSGNVYHRAVCSRAIGQGEARCMAHVRTDAYGRPLAGKPDGAAPNVTPSGYGPTALRSAYNVTATGSSATVVAIVDAYGYPNAESDLATYRSTMGLPPCTSASGCFIKLDQRGGTAYPRLNTGWAQEQALDVDMASAMCPNCRIMLVQSNSASYADLATAVNLAAARGALVISNSYGGGESGSASYNSAYTHPGVAITASTGDSGYGASFPATSPGVIAVGGTSLVRAANTRGWSESAWSGGGSGCSSTYAKPVWQTDGLCARRMEADLSAVADPATGVAVYGPTGIGSKSGWLVFGGTSVSAPLIGGIYGALGLGAANGASKIWATAATGTGFNDVTAGSNGACSGLYLCTAGVGYDGPTGWGSPSGAAGF